MRYGGKFRIRLQPIIIRIELCKIVVEPRKINQFNEITFAVYGLGHVLGLHGVLGVLGLNHVLGLHGVLGDQGHVHGTLETILDNFC